MIMTCHDKSPQETFKIITSLCGVDIPFDNNVVYNLKKAITHYAVNKRIVQKLEECNSSCSKDENNKFNYISYPIEYSDSNVNKSDEVARILDGGKRNIEKRYQIYGGILKYGNQN